MLPSPFAEPRGVRGGGGGRRGVHEPDVDAGEEPELDGAVGGARPEILCHPAAEPPQRLDLPALHPP